MPRTRTGTPLAAATSSSMLANSNGRAITSTTPASPTAINAATRACASLRPKIDPNRTLAFAALFAVALDDSLATSTVYRNLTVLEELGVVHRVITNGEFAHYELAEDLTEHHHHLVCSNCGAVDDVKASPKLEQSVRDAAREIARRTGFRTERHLLDLIGRCSRCA